MGGVGGGAARGRGRARAGRGGDRRTGRREHGRARVIFNLFCGLLTMCNVVNAALYFLLKKIIY